MSAQEPRVHLAPALGLRGRLMLALLAAFALLAGLLALDFAEDRKVRIDAASTDLLNHSRLIAAETRTFAAQADAILNGMMLNPEMQPGAPAEACAQFLQVRLKQEPGFIQGGRTLLDGEVACAAVAPKGRVSFADRSWFQPALKSHEIVISEVLQGRVVGNPIIVFAKAMRDVAGRVTGVLFLSLDLDWLQRELASPHLPEGARLVVVDSKGTIAVRHPDPDGRVGMTTVFLPLLQRVQAAGGDGTDDDVGPDGERRLFAYTKLLETVSGPIYLWLSVPKTVVEAPAQRAALFGIGIMLAVFVGTLGLLVWGGNRLVLRPLLILSRTAACFKAGDLTARSGLPHGNDEVGGLAQTLDETAAAIEDRERKLAHANRALRVLSAGNRALLRSKGEQDLIQEMCRAIVQAGDYRMAWVAYAEDDPARNVRIAAAWGGERDSLDRLKITWDESESGRGPTGAAIRRGVPIVSNNVAADPDYAPWQELAQRHGFASALALPLRLGDTGIGALCICAAEPDVFDEAVIELLSEAADDLVFGIAKHRAEVEHGRTREALQSTEERFHAAAEADLDALFILTSVRGERGDILDFTFTDINPRAEQMLGMARGQVIGQKLCELIPINRTAGFFDKYVAVVATGTPLEEEFPIDAPQIKAEWLRHQVVRVGDGVAISSRDITAWKGIGSALKESEQRFRAVVETVPDILYEADGSNHISATTYVSPALHALTGFEPAEFLGDRDRWAKQLHEHDRQRVLAVVRRALDSGAADYTMDYRLWHKDGRTLLWFEDRAKVQYDMQGKPLRIFGVMTDITERKRNAEQLQQQIEELRRWQGVMLARENRVLELKSRIIELHRRLGEPAPFPSAEPS